MKISSIIIILLSTILVVLSYTIIVLLMPVNFKNGQITVNIPTGMDAGDIIELLSEKGMVRDKKLIHIYGVLSGMDKHLKAGTYIFKSGMSPIEILRKLRSGKYRILYNAVTILQGKTLWDIADTLEQSNIMERETFLSLAYDRLLLDKLKIKGESLEGYIYPDTYKMEKGTQPEDAITMMVNNLRAHYTKDIEAGINSFDIDEHEVLTLASIIEKEAIRDSERPIISAVYHNRLRRGMKLQADPTCIYGIKHFSKGITRRDLENDSPYNTYRIKGLPPGPIASPSIKSIIASIKPASVPYLYFVAKNDGTHYFSKTYSEHRKAIRKYRKKRGKLARK